MKEIKKRKEKKMEKKKKYVVLEIEVGMEDGYIVEGEELYELYRWWKDEIIDILDEYERKEVVDEFDISWIEMLRK